MQQLGGIVELGALTSLVESDEPSRQAIHTRNESWLIPLPS